MNQPTTPGPEIRDQELATVEKTLAIYTVLSRSKTALYLSDIENTSGLPRRTVQRHLDFLEDRGFVQRTGAGRYLLNPAARLPLGIADHEGIDQVLGDFVERTGRDVALATLNGGKLEITHLHPNPTGESLLGDVHPTAIHATGAGKCLLAQLPTADERRRLMILNGMPRYTSRTITDIEALERNLQAQRGQLLGADGAWSAEGEYCETGACLAVLAHPGSTYSDNIALTTSVQTSEFTEAREHLSADLHRAVALLQSVVGPLVAAEFGRNSG